MKERLFRNPNTLFNTVGFISVGYTVYDTLINDAEHRQKAREAYDKLSREEKFQEAFLAHKFKKAGCPDHANYGIAGITQLRQHSIRSNFHAGLYKQEYRQWKWKQIHDKPTQRISKKY